MRAFSLGREVRISYQQNIPNGGDNIDLSQPGLQTNFFDIFQAFQVNHFSINGTNKGMHTQLCMPVQTDDPGTLSDETALYCKLGTSSQPQIFYQPPSGATPIQLSYQTVVQVNTNPGASLCYQSYMAGPYIILFGEVIGMMAGDNFVYATYYPGITFSSNPYIFLTADTTEIADISKFKNERLVASAVDITTTQFTIEKPIVSIECPFSIYFLIIGQP